MKTVYRYILGGFLFLLAGCEQKATQPDAFQPREAISTFWKSASIYFLLTDRFCNGDPSNDFPLGRKNDGSYLRGFLGGDLKGVTQKINEGYFDSLGVSAIWLTPFLEQLHGKLTEDTLATYGFHGYWMHDWTNIDPNFGTRDDLREMVNAAHRKGIRILMDAVINHTGPDIPSDIRWPDEWVRTSPRCTYQDHASTVECTLVANLPDIRTEKKDPVALPGFLLEKWKAEGRLEQEQKELDDFFARTGYPRAPRYYLIKWLTDWIREFGIDGFRVDTVKHTEEDVWDELKKEARLALQEWKSKHPGQKTHDEEFFMMGEVYGFGLGGDRLYDFGDKKVDYFNHGFESLINFAFKSDVTQPAETVFRKYSAALNGGALNGVGVVSYLASHDDDQSFDRSRRDPIAAGTKLLLAPGAIQIYYGDEIARPLIIPNAVGDAQLRSFMNWDELAQNSRRGGYTIRQVFEHWGKLGRFRKNHPAVGAGIHKQLQESLYLFSRVIQDGEDLVDYVLVGLELPYGEKIIPVFDLFKDGDQVRDYYSGQETEVKEGMIRFDTPFDLLLIEPVGRD